MPVGVYIACDDPFVADSVAHAIGVGDDCYPAPSVDGADVVLAEPHLMPAATDAALVVLASGDPIAAARAAVARGADGLAVWPDEPASLQRIVCQAAARRRPAARGFVIAVRGARGGAGATTLAAHLAGAFASGALLIDARGGPAGQALYARTEPAVTLTDSPAVAAEPSVRALRAMTAPHASGAECLYGGAAPPPAGTALIACARGMAPIVVVDGDAADADLTVIVCGADVGSVRGAAALLPGAAGRTEIVLNGAGRGRVRARDARRALGIERVTVVPHDPRLAKAADLGRLARRGDGRRAIARLAKRLKALAPS